METLKLRWLGPALVEWDGQAVKLETRKAAALLACLSLAPGKCQRETLAAMFWPEGTQQKALANLRRTLASLNASLPGRIEADRESIALKAGIWVDAVVFQECLSRLHAHNHPQNEICEACLSALEQAAGLYRGEFLEGLNLGDAPGFDEWQLFQRDELRLAFGQALRRLAWVYAERGQWERAISCARRRAALDRVDEPAGRDLMKLYARSGQRSAAVRQYEDLARALEERAGREPEPETRRLYEQLHAQTSPGRAAEHPETAGAFPLLKTKLYIPGAPAARVVRSGLVERLSEAGNRALTILSAPAGFGKTTLLAEWIAQTRLPVAWLSLDNGDNDPFRFLSYLIAALESLQDGIGIEARRIMQASQPAPAHIILASLINDLARVAGPSILVLDDYQFISEHQVHEALAYLLDHIPANLHLVISTRADPPLQLGRLRASDQLLELRTQDLRFTPREAAEFLNAVMRLGLSAAEVQTLETRTEGWVVGLKMAGLSLKGRAHASEFIRAFSGSHRYVLDYLVEEVLRRQPARVQTFLLHTSILEKLSAALCDVLMGEEWRQSGENSQAVLEYLERSNLFLIPLDDERAWFRYHHLFSDLLQARLQAALGAQAVTRLHVCASDWHAQNGSLLEAIQHASLASDDERVERFIEQNYIELVRGGEQTWLRYWTSKLSKELVYRRPWLCIYEAYSHSWFGELDEAERLLDEAERRIQGLAGAPEAPLMQAHRAYVKSRVTAMRGDLPRAIEYCLAAREHIPASNLALQLDSLITLGYEYFLNGDYARGGPVLEETVHSGASAGAVINTVAAACVLARLYANQGRLEKSYETCQMAARSIPQASGKHLGARGLVEFGLAEVLCEWDELEAALAHMQQGLNWLPFWDKADDLALAQISLARIQLARGNLDAAAEAVEKAVRFVQGRNVFSEARQAIELARVKLCLARGDLQSAGRWAAALGEPPGGDSPIGFAEEPARTGQARILLAQGKAAEAGVLLARLEDSARAGGRLSRLIEILNLKALALQAGGNHPQALSVLKESLALAAPAGYLRIFLDEGRPLLDLLGQMETSGLEPGIGKLINRLLEA